MCVSTIFVEKKCACFLKASVSRLDDHGENWVPWPNQLRITAVRKMHTNIQFCEYLLDVLQEQWKEGCVYLIVDFMYGLLHLMSYSSTNSLNYPLQLCVFDTPESSTAYVKWQTIHTMVVCCSLQIFELISRSCVSHGD